MPNRIYRYLLVACLIIGGILAAGVAMHIFTTGSAEVGINAPPSSEHDAILSYNLYDRNFQADTYRERGVVQFTGLHNQSELVFRDVHFCLYDTNGSILNSTNLGNFNGTSAETSYDIRAPEEPFAITIDHPKFHEQDVRTTSLVKNEDGLFERYKTSLGNVQDEFAYPRHNGSGQCL